MGIFKRKRGHLLLPHKQNRLERMWSTLKWIRHWNRMGGGEIFIEPKPEAINKYSKLKRKAERRYIRNNKARIKEWRIGFKKAVALIWKEGKGTI